MEIKLDFEDELNIIIDNEGLANDNYVNLTVGATVAGGVPIDDLYLAIKTFFDIKELNRGNDEFYK